MSMNRTDGEHYRAIRAAMDAILLVVKIAEQTGLVVDIKLEKNNDETWDTHLWVDRRIDVNTP